MPFLCVLVRLKRLLVALLHKINTMTMAMKTSKMIRTSTHTTAMITMTAEDKGLPLMGVAGLSVEPSTGRDAGGVL